MWKRLGIIAVLVSAASCPKPVDQNINSGEDAWYKDAVDIELDNKGHGRDVDKVTYPGGDRVDWKRVELPEGLEGTLKIKLRFTPPRPGLDLAYIVYDSKFRRVARAKPSPDRGTRTKKLSIKDARGRYYIQVYAPRRTDAADYVLTVEFSGKPAGVKSLVLDAGINVDDPPTLPAVDPSIYADAGVGRPRIDATPPPDAAVDAAPKRIIDGLIINRVVATTKRVKITINRGDNFGIKRNWKGHVLQRDTGAPLAGGEFTIGKVTKRESEATVTLSIDQVEANTNVQIFEP